MIDIAIIGGGASGIMCAISAKMNNKDAEVVVFERSSKCLKKLLATGNGKCNLTNMQASEKNFYSDGEKNAFDIIKKFPPVEIVKFFEEIGLLTSDRFYPLIYPNSMQASSVRDVLLTAAYSRGVKIFCDYEISGVNKSENEFLITTKKGKEISAKKVVFAGGSNATSGSDSVLGLVEKLGHRVVSYYPALTGLVCKQKKRLEILDGARAYAKVTLVCRDREIKSDIGEIQFCAYGLSGIVVMQLSAEAIRLKNQGEEAFVSVSFLFDKDDKTIRELLKLRRREMGSCGVKKALSSMVNSSVAEAIETELFLGREEKFGELSDSDLENVLKFLTDMRFDIEGSRGAQFAQVCGGGASLDMLGAGLESEACEGMYVIGEAVDVCGDCGGFNLTWAWASGYIAGKSAGKV